MFSGRTAVSVNSRLMSVSGTLTVSDPDGRERVVAQTDTLGDYGSFSIDTAGAWTYTLGAAARSLPLGVSETDTFTVTADDDDAGDDGPATVELAITITGTIAPAVFGGDDSATIGEDAGAPRSGTLTVSNPGGGETFVAQTDAPGDYGRFSINARGAWTYALTAGAQTLAANQIEVDRFAVITAGVNPASTEVAITVNGADDDPAPRLTAPPVNTYPSGFVLPVAGESGDPDAFDRIRYRWSVASPASGERGRFANANAAATTWTAPNVTGDQAFVLRLSVSDDDGAHEFSVTRTVTIQRPGSHQIVGDKAHSINEGDFGVQGTLGYAPLVGFQSGFGFGGQDIAREYGTLIIIPHFAGPGFSNPNLRWRYELDNNNPAVNALAAGETLTDILPVSATSPGGDLNDAIVITIRGVNDPPSARHPRTAGEYRGAHQ